MTLTFAGSVVGQSAWTNSGAQNTTLNAYKSYAKILITGWFPNTADDWCTPAKTATTTITICGPYVNFGFTFTDTSGGSCASTEWAAADQWHLDSTYALYKCNATCEAVMDWRITEYVDYYKALLVNGFTACHHSKTGTGITAAFFDNGYFDVFYNGYWTNNNGGVNEASWKTTMVNALATIRTYYDAQGDTIVLNGWSDITDSATYPNDPAYYRSVVDKVQYVVYEDTVANPNGGAFRTESAVVNYLTSAIDYNENTSTTVLWSTEYGGDFWYAFVTGLFTCTSTKCGYWQQPAMTSDQITKTTTLALGVPTAAYSTSGCYYRTFTNGIAVANLTSSNCNYTLPAGNYTDWIAGGTVSGQRTLGAHTGKIYIVQ